MADNVDITPGTGATVAADDIGSVKFQRVKMVWGGDGTCSDASSTNPVPVVMTPGTFNVTSVATVATLTTITNVVHVDDNSGALTVDGTVSATSAGDIAHDAADSGNPVKQGFKASNSLSGITLVADADRTHGYAGLDGVQIVRPHCNLEDILSSVRSTATSTSIQFFGSVSSVKTNLVTVTVVNTSATNTTVDLLDGATVKWTLPVPASAGVVFSPPVPIRGTENTAWNFQAAANVSSIIFSGLGFKSKV